MVFESIYSFCLNYAVILAGIAFLFVICLDFYTRNVKVNLDTDNVDLMQRYMWLQMRRRYNCGTI